MRYCDKCKVHVAGSHEHCPLCQRSLQVEDSTGEGNEVFPYVPTLAKRYQMAFKIVNFICISLIVLSLSVNLMVSKGHWWSAFIIVGVVCFWVSSIIAIKKRKNLMKNLLYQIVLVSGIMVLWDYIIGWKGWSLDFAIPGLLAVNLLVLLIFTLFRKKDGEDYFVYLLIGCVFSLVPAVFYLLNWIRHTIPTIISVTFGILVLVGTAVFRGEKIREELHRRLHYK